MAESKVIFEDNEAIVIGKANNLIEAALLEVSAELVSATARNTRTDQGQLKNSWAAKVKSTGSGFEATIGSPLENAIWEEFGTGEHALKGNGRKGGWYVPAENLSSKAKSRMQKRTVNGKDYYFTYGKKPSRAFWKAYISEKSKIEKRLKKALVTLEGE